jgi:hypothetical protein
MRPGSGGRGAGRNLCIAVSNSVTGDAVFAGNGQKSACRHAATSWPRGGGPLSRLFIFCYGLFFPKPSTATPFVVTTATNDITMKRIATHSDLCESGESGNENSLTRRACDVLNPPPWCCAKKRQKRIFVPAASICNHMSPSSHTAEKRVLI